MFRSMLHLFALHVLLLSDLSNLLVCEAEPLAEMDGEHYDPFVVALCETDGPDGHLATAPSAPHQGIAFWPWC